MSSRGSVYFRDSDKRWVGKLQIPNDPFTGKRQKPKYVYSRLEGRKGKQEAERKLQKVIDTIDAGDFSEIYKMTVSGWLDKYLKVYCKKREVTTKEGYQRYIDNHIKPILGDIKLHDLKPMQIENFYNLERKAKNKNGKIGYSEKTILQEHRILHRAFKKAVGDGMLSKNPCDAVDTPSPEEYEPTIYNEEQFAKLLDKLHDHRMEAIILIAGMCGLRRGELLGLTWEDIDFENNLINVHKNRVPTHNEGVIEKGTKTKKSTRTFAIPSIIMPELKRLRGIGKLYTCLDGSEYHPGSVSNAFSKFLDTNGLQHIRLHDMRHFNGTMMLKYGVSEKEIMERGGWSTVAMVKKYQHVLKEMDKKSADKLNNVLKKKKQKGVKTGVKA